MYSPVSDWFAICCLTASGDEDLGGVLLYSNENSVRGWHLFQEINQSTYFTAKYTYCFSGCTTATFLSFSTEKHWNVCQNNIPSHWHQGEVQFKMSSVRIPSKHWRVAYLKAWWGTPVGSRLSHTSWQERCRGSPRELSALASAASDLYKYKHSC